MLTAMILIVAVIQQWECLSYALQGSCHGLTVMDYSETMVRKYCGEVYHRYEIR